MSGTSPETQGPGPASRHGLPASSAAEPRAWARVVASSNERNSIGFPRRVPCHVPARDHRLAAARSGASRTGTAPDLRIARARGSAGPRVSPRRPFSRPFSRGDRRRSRKHPRPGAPVPSPPRPRRRRRLWSATAGSGIAETAFIRSLQRGHRSRAISMMRRRAAAPGKPATSSVLGDVGGGAVGLAPASPPRGCRPRVFREAARPPGRSCQPVRVRAVPCRGRACPDAP